MIIKLLALLAARTISSPTGRTPVGGATVPFVTVMSAVPVVEVFIYVLSLMVTNLPAASPTSQLPCSAVATTTVSPEASTVSGMIAVFVTVTPFAAVEMEASLPISTTPTPVSSTAITPYVFVIFAAVPDTFV